MAQPVPPCRVVVAALFVGLAAAQAGAQAPHGGRAVFEPLAGVQVGYERFGADAGASGRIDGAVASPVGTLRTSLHVVPGRGRQIQPADFSYELPAAVFGGHLQVRELGAGGRGASWGGQLLPGFNAEAHWERTPVRSAGALRMRQVIGDGDVVQAVLSTARTAWDAGSRCELELAQATRGVRWSAGLDAAERGYVSAWGGPEARYGVHMGAQWLLFPHAWMEAKFSHHVRWDTEQAASRAMLGSRFELPRLFTLVAALELDTDQEPRAKLSLSVPLGRH